MAVFQQLLGLAIAQGSDHFPVQIAVHHVLQPEPGAGVAWGPSKAGLGSCRGHLKSKRPKALDPLGPPCCASMCDPVLLYFLCLFSCLPACFCPAFPSGPFLRLLCCALLCCSCSAVSGRASAPHSSPCFEFAFGLDSGGLCFPGFPDWSPHACCYAHGCKQPHFRQHSHVPRCSCSHGCTHRHRCVPVTFAEAACMPCVQCAAAVKAVSCLPG